MKNGSGLSSNFLVRIPQYPEFDCLIASIDFLFLATTGLSTQKFLWMKLTIAHEHQKAISFQLFGIFKNERENLYDYSVA